MENNNTQSKEPTCGTCGNELTLVRPGKHQCDYCQSKVEGEKPDFENHRKEFINYYVDRREQQGMLSSLSQLYNAYVAPLHSRIKELEQQLDKAQESITKLFKYMDDGVIVRDISRDLEDGWHVRMLHLTMDLKEASQFVKSQPLPPKPENK